MEFALAENYFIPARFSEVREESTAIGLLGFQSKHKAVSAAEIDTCTA